MPLMNDGWKPLPSRRLDTSILQCYNTTGTYNRSIPTVCMYICWYYALLADTAVQIYNMDVYVCQYILYIYTIIAVTGDGGFCELENMIIIYHITSKYYILYTYIYVSRRFVLAASCFHDYYPSIYSLSLVSRSSIL